MELAHFDGFNHLADGRIGGDENGVTIFFGKVKGLSHHIEVFLYGVGREDNGAVVAVAAAAGHLPIVALALGDVAEAGADAHDVNDNRGQIGRNQIGDALLIE